MYSCATLKGSPAGTADREPGPVASNRPRFWKRGRARPDNSGTNWGSGAVLQRHSAWDSFAKDENLRKLHNITDQELQTLSQVALMGEVRRAHDFIHILIAIRQALGR
jgi:hypothetical protein